ncbi:MAG: nuclear transport factor 2 family protein [Sphingobacteriales bacterium]|nr:MAG: nuclear transport factor 2 family protein [Sphingobacteriales bacterium]
MLIVLIFVFPFLVVNAQSKFETKPYTPVSKPLYDSIAHMDSVLFDAFNSQDLEKIKTIFSPDLEFYHDKGGLDNYIETLKKSKQLFDQNNGLKRTLVAGSMEVYPIKGFGAIQTGLHRFCHPENGKENCGTFKFMHIWQNNNGVWKITRVVSYDH